MRKISFAPNEYYHLCGRGVDKREIFYDDRDRTKFLFLLLHLQSPIRINNTSFYVSSFLKTGNFTIGEKKVKEIIKGRHVEVVSFSLMPNHFHILVKNLEDQIVSVYMHRVLTSYSKYFNTKYKKTGHVFEGPYRAVHIDNNNHLLHASAYVHKNPIGIDSKETVDYEKYPWSSYPDFIQKNRWGELLKTGVILEQFKSQDSYKNFVSTSKTKEI